MSGLDDKGGENGRVNTQLTTRINSSKGNTQLTAKRAVTRTKRTMRRMHPLVREVQAIQNDLIKLASRLERVLPKIEAAALEQDFGEAERARMQPLTQELLRIENEAKGREVRRG